MPMLYQFLIGPLELIFETIYGIAKLLFGNPGLSIFFLSLTMNILLLPLYKRADAIQEEERQITKRLAPWVGHIKKTFSGDERYLMLQTYYRQNHYKPFYTLRGSLPLLLEIPFFLAAYHFLSHLPELKGTPFGPIKDLGAPDGLLTIGSLTVHVLPILMTLINAVSSAIYTKGLSRRDKIQLYGMALIFLLLLYESPAGLVFYWTLNNLFSLVKNLFAKLREPKKVLQWMLAILGLLLFGFAVFVYHPARWTYRAMLIAAALLAELPGLKAFLQKRQALPAGTISLPASDFRRFLALAVFLTVLTGVLIPSSVVMASPAEFIRIADYHSPLRHVWTAFLLAAGLFVLWFGIFYYLAGEKARSVFEAVLWVACGASLLNYMAFGTKLSNLSAELKYDTPPLFSRGEILLNLGLLLGLALLLGFFWFRKTHLIRSAVWILVLAAGGMSILNVVRIRNSVSDMENVVAQAPDQPADFTISKNGKNVIVLMLDRAIGSYLPYLFQEDPALAGAFEGFTYYPNTVSHGAYTIFGAPALYGGYEYTPEEMNRRTEEKLSDKHNEALKVMPVLFDQAGFSVTVFDPVYAGYTWIPDLSVYRDYPRIRTFLTEQGEFSALSGELSGARLDGIWKRNFFCYSLMKISPLILQPSLYQGGSYFAASSFVRWTQQTDGLSRAKGLRNSFMNSWAVLKALPDIVKIEEGSENTFLLMSNSATHEPMLLSEPAYEPAEEIDNTAYDAAHEDRFILKGRRMRVESADQMAHYQTNMACLKQLGRFFDFLRSQGVYDNTRIILVADHGRDLGQFDDMKFGTEYFEDAMFFNPLLLVKDFDARDFVLDDRFMTNADVPTLAFSGLIEDPHNPFTGKAISSDRKEEGPQRILFSTNIETDKNMGNVFEPGIWYEVDEDIFDSSRWKKLGAY